MHPPVATARAARCDGAAGPRWFGVTGIPVPKRWLRPCVSGTWSWFGSDTSEDRGVSVRASCPSCGCGRPGFAVGLGGCAGRGDQTPRPRSCRWEERTRPRRGDGAGFLGRRGRMEPHQRPGPGWPLAKAPEEAAPALASSREAPEKVLARKAACVSHQGPPPTGLLPGSEVRSQAGQSSLGAAGVVTREGGQLRGVRVRPCRLLRSCQAALLPGPSAAAA